MTQKSFLLKARIIIPIFIILHMFAFRPILVNAKESTKYDYVFQNNTHLYGSQLNEESQYYYLILLKRLKVPTEKEFSISIVGKDKNEISNAINNALNALFYDFPDYQWLKLGGKNSSYFKINYVNGKATKLVFYPVIKDEYKNTSEILKEFSKTEEVLDKIIKNMPKEYSTRYDRLKYIHDYLVKYITYDTTLQGDKIHSAYGALVEKKSVCEGYAKAFKLACEKLNIPSQLVTSDTHMWNYVMMDDGAWYVVDVTFDDPLLNGTSDYKDGKNLNHKYFLVGANSVAKSKDHKVNNNLNAGSFYFSTKTLAKNDYDSSKAKNEKLKIATNRFSEGFIKDLTKPIFYVSKKTLGSKESYIQSIKKLSNTAIITYHSNKSTVAKVNQKGKISAVGTGSCVITTTVKQGGKTYVHKLNLTVKE